MLEAEDEWVTINMLSDGEGQTRRVKVQVGEIGCTRYPTRPRFVPMFFLLGPKLAFQAWRRNDRKQELPLPNLRFGEPGGEGSWWERRRHIETRWPEGR